MNNNPNPIKNLIVKFSIEYIFLIIALSTVLKIIFIFNTIPVGSTIYDIGFGFGEYIKNIIKRDNEYTLNVIIRENYFKWYEKGQVYYKNKSFGNYLYFIINYCIENESDNCLKIINIFLKELGLSKNLHKKNIIKYIKWKNSI